jgi:hypothetical protein
MALVVGLGGGAFALWRVRRLGRLPVWLGGADTQEFLRLSRRLVGEGVVISSEHGESIRCALVERGQGRRLRELAQRIERGEALTPEHETLAREILKAWYGGVVESATGPQLVTYAESLAHRVTQDLHPLSLHCSKFGAWAEAPGA